MQSHELNVRAIVLAGGAIALVVAASIATVFFLLGYWNFPAGGEHWLSTHDFEISGPMLQSAPQHDLAAYHAEKRRQLESIGWVDKSRDIARIPVADAIEILASRQTGNDRPTGAKP